MNKKLIKRAAVVSLAALMTIPNIIGTAKPAYASVPLEEMNSNDIGGCDIDLPISGVISIGNGLSKFTTANGEERVAYTAEIQEYLNLVASGQDHKLTSVTSMFTDFVTKNFKCYVSNYNIVCDEYGNSELVVLPDNAMIQMKDKFSFGPLLVEKYLAGMQKTTNQFAMDLRDVKQYVMNENAKKAEEDAKDAAEQVITDKWLEIRDTERPNGADMIRFRSDKLYAIKATSIERVKQLSEQSINNLKNARVLSYKWLEGTGRGQPLSFISFDINLGKNDDSWDDYFKNFLREKNGHITDYTIMLYPTSRDEKGVQYYAKTRFNPAVIYQKCAIGYFLLTEDYNIFVSETTSSIQQFWQDMLTTFPNASNYEKEQAAKLAYSLFANYGKDIKEYVLKLRESNAMSQEEKDEIERMRNEAREADKKFDAAWGNE